MSTILFSFNWLKHCKIPFKPLIINWLIKTRMVKWMVVGDARLEKTILGLCGNKEMLYWKYGTYSCYIFTLKFSSF